MAIDLNTLTSPATSGDVLAEALTTADFLEPVPVLRNLARGSQKGGDAKQDVALNQPRALPLTADSNGVVGGYLYQPDVTGNAPAVNIPSIAANEDFVFEMEVYLVNATNFHLASGADANNRFGIYNNGFYFSPEAVGLTSPLSTGASTLTVERSGTTATLKQNGVTKATHTANISDNTYTFTHLSFNGQFGTSIGRINGYIKKATLSIEGTQVFNIDFTATNVRHGDTKFKCATGQVVTVNQSGNDPATIIKKSVLRFDGVNGGLDGLFASSVDNGYMFAAFSVLGDGGENYARIFTTNQSGQTDVVASSWIWSLRNATSTGIGYYNNNSFYQTHTGMYDDARGDYLHEHKVISGSQKSKINNADLKTNTVTTSLVLDEFHIGVSEIAGDNNASIDLEFLALFPASITDAEADSVRNYINNRNNVFYRWDTDGYYFFDPQKATFTGNFTGFGGGNRLDGYITGSDNGDTDVRSNLTLIQSTENAQPSTDAYTITFSDSAEHLKFKNEVSQNLSGWQIVGTSLGTFAYRVQGAVSELNLLGNAGNASYRQAGQSYGMILLPDSATGADIEAARKLLIDRGASDGVAPSDCSNFWRGRADIVIFKSINFNSVTNITSAWRGNSAMTTFTVSFPSVTQASNAFLNCTSLSDFRTTDLKNCADFTSAWRGCSALTSFPSGAKLGTSAQNVNFTDSWRDSALQSFPALNLSKGTNLTRGWFFTPLASFGAIDASSSTNFSSAWHGTGALTSFPAAAKLGTSAVNVNFTNAWRSSGITSFSTPLPTTNRIVDGFNSCASLTDFSADVFADWNPQDLASGVFHDTWKGCTALTANSVEAILTSIDASNQHGTDDGTSTGNPLGDSGIDIDYNVATGSLSAATNAAVTSLKSKGWSIIVNNVTL